MGRGWRGVACMMRSWFGGWGGWGGGGGVCFFFNDTATTEIYTLSLHDALPIYQEATQDVHESISEGDGDETNSLGEKIASATDENALHLQASVSQQTPHDVLAQKKPVEIGRAHV